MARQKRGAAPMTTKRYAIQQRRAKVATLLRAARSQRAIAGTLNVSLGTVNSDVEALYAEWRQRQGSAVEEARLLDLERLDALLRTLWQPAMQGSLPAIDRVLRILQLRGDIIGYVAASGGGGSSGDGGGRGIEIIEVRLPSGPPAEPS